MFINSFYTNPLEHRECVITENVFLVLFLILDLI